MPEVPPGPRADGGDPGGSSRAPTHGGRAGVRVGDPQDEPALDEERDGSASMGLGSINGDGR
eukprot:3363522-Heterocapsa_arctica.AAC.1